MSMTLTSSPTNSGAQTSQSMVWPHSVSYCHCLSSVIFAICGAAKWKIISMVNF